MSVLKNPSNPFFTRVTAFLLVFSQGKDGFLLSQEWQMGMMRLSRTQRGARNDRGRKNFQSPCL